MQKNHLKVCRCHSCENWLKCFSRFLPQKDESEIKRNSNDHEADDDDNEAVTDKIILTFFYLKDIRRRSKVWHQFDQFRLLDCSLSHEKTVSLSPFTLTYLHTSLSFFLSLSLFCSLLYLSLSNFPLYYYRYLTSQSLSYFISVHDSFLLYLSNSFLLYLSFFLSFIHSLCSLLYLSLSIYFVFFLHILLFFWANYFFFVALSFTISLSITYSISLILSHFLYLSFFFYFFKSLSLSLSVCPFSHPTSLYHYVYAPLFGCKKMCWLRSLARLDDLLTVFSFVPRLRPKISFCCNWWLNKLRQNLH